MSAHISDELPRMLTGEANRDAVLAAADHLRTCVDCQHELVSATVAHASLTSAQRFAPEIISGAFTGNYFADAGLNDDDHSVLPIGPTIGMVGSARFVDGVDATAHGLANVPDGNPVDPSASSARHSTDDGTHTTDDATLPGLSALPDLSAVFAQVRSEAAASQRTRRTSARRPTRSRVLVGAAAAVVVLGGGGAIYAATSGDSGGSVAGPTAGRPFQLSAYDKGHTSATATLADSGTISINASSLPQVAGQRYEVWLTNDARTKMQPVGWLRANGKAALTVPKDIIAQYQDVEVSIQKVQTNDYAYSNVSVLRGSME